MILYKFYKPDCHPCKLLKKIMSKFELPEDIELVEINAELEENLPQLEQHDVDVVPTLIFENGNRMIGVRSKAVLEPWIKNYGNQDSRETV